MISDLQHEVCEGCKFHIYHYSAISADCDYYTCILRRSADKCKQGMYNE